MATYTATVTKTKSAQPAGVYVPTQIDAQKAAAEFRLTACFGNKNAIVWRDGRIETVSNRRLAKLQAAHTWATDF